ncbi:MAG: peroxiredoxin [Chlorobi bacterium]|nr:peroxiredoxin [Chlorobiota bacterium]
MEKSRAMLQVGKPIQDFEFQYYDPKTDQWGRMRLYDILKEGKWVIMFWYPADFTFVCPTELADLAAFAEEFDKYNTEVISFSTDTPYVHRAWRQTEPLLKDFNFLMGSDASCRISRDLGIFSEEEEVAYRSTIIIDPEGTVRGVEVIQNNIGRSAKELVRKLAAFIYVDQHPEEVCPAEWEPGKETLKPGAELVGKVGEVWHL